MLTIKALLVRPLKNVVLSGSSMAIVLLASAFTQSGHAATSNQPLSATDINLEQLAQLGALTPQTLSTQGNGQASIPASQAAIVFTYTSNICPEYAEDGTLKVPPTDQASDLKNIMDALVAVGVSRNDIEVSTESYDYFGFRMVVKLENPTRDRISQLKDVAAKAAIADGKFSPAPVAVYYVVRDCEQARNTARDLAIADARTQAEALAESANLNLGRLNAIAGGLNGGYSSISSCPTNLDEIIDNIDQSGVGTYYPGTPEVVVNFSVYATYTIEP